jgi:hypothetical protein
MAGAEYFLATVCSEAQMGVSSVLQKWWGEKFSNRPCTFPKCFAAITP